MLSLHVSPLRSSLFIISLAAVSVIPDQREAQIEGTSTLFTVNACSWAMLCTCSILKVSVNYLHVCLYYLSITSYLCTCTCVYILMGSDSLHFSSSSPPPSPCAPSGLSSQPAAMLSCPLCHCNYTTTGENQPRLLTVCGHTFCYRCLEERKSSDSPDTFQCPQCSLPCTENHVPNITIMKYVDAMDEKPEERVRRWRKGRRGGGQRGRERGREREERGGAHTHSHSHTHTLTHTLTHTHTLQPVHQLPASQQEVTCQACQVAKATLVCFQCLPTGFPFCDACSSQEHNRDFPPVQRHSPKPVGAVK